MVLITKEHIGESLKETRTFSFMSIDKGGELITDVTGIDRSVI